MPVSGLKAEGDVLSWHPIESRSRIPTLVDAARVTGKVRRPGNGGGAVNGREERQITARIVHPAAAESEAVFIAVEPKPVIEHPAGKTLFGVAIAVVVATNDGSRRRTAVLTAEVACE